MAFEEGLESAGAQFNSKSRQCSMPYSRLKKISYISTREQPLSASDVRCIKDSTFDREERADHLLAALDETEMELRLLELVFFLLVETPLQNLFQNG